MLFQNNFYTVKSEDLSESTANFNIELNGDHKIFEGHFPDNPITPGVVQMEIVKELMSKVTNSSLNLVTMGNCKFLAILNPRETKEVLVAINYSLTEENRYKVSAQIRTKDVIYLKISAFYQPA
ncbi:MAG: 3-hydroxyacyl-ACP dehydratase [Flavobacteriales bacterium]|nr:3-hydroxyacyl-ACP dehydratase [Flavobacteriales bacterium]